MTHVTFAVQSMHPDRAPWDRTKGVPVTRLPSLEEQNNRAHAAYRQVERYIFETEIVPRVTPEIIDEHRARPIGKHSDDLERVLTYLRKNHLEMKGKYILVCTKPHEEYRIAVITGEPDKPPVLLDDAFTDRFEAEHAIFLKRLRDHGLLDGVTGVSA
jgi:hypothetical protein